MYTTYGSYGAETGILAVLGGFLIGIVLISVAVAVVSIIGMWKIFTKAGEEGWKALIPVYNVYTLCKIVGVNPWWILILFLSPVLSVIPVVGALLESAITIYFAVLLAVSTANSFGKDTGFAVGLVLLSPVFYCILGCGSAQYVGKKPMHDLVFDDIFKSNNNNNNNNTQNTNNTAPAGGKSCPNCGAAVPSDSAFCTSCGNKVD